MVVASVSSARNVAVAVGGLNMLAMGVSSGGFNVLAVRRGGGQPGFVKDT